MPVPFGRYGDQPPGRRPAPPCSRGSSTIGCPSTACPFRGWFPGHPRISVCGMQHKIPEGFRTRVEVAAEIGERAMRALVASGQLRELWCGILVPHGQLLDPLVRATVALRALGPEAALTGRTAAWLQGCPAACDPTVHVAVPYSRHHRSREGLAVHRGRTLLDDVVLVRGLRTVALDVAVSELLCTDVPRHALAVADQAAALWAVGTERAEFCARISARLGQRPDWRGTLRAAHLLDLVTGKADSPPESWLRLLVVEAGFPPPVMQFEICGLDGRLRYVLDQSWPELRVALEYDGYEAHEDRGPEDRRRDEDLARRGWITVRARADDLRDPSRILRELDGAFQARGVVPGPPVLMGSERRQRRQPRW